MRHRNSKKWDNTHMKQLPEKYSKYGYNFKLLKRNDKVAIYSQSTHPDLPEDGKACDYEVIVIQRQKANTFKRGDTEIAVEAREMVPSTEEWGTKGWTLATKEAAYAKFDEITSLLESRSQKKGIVATNQTP